MSTSKAAVPNTGAFSERLSRLARLESDELEMLQAAERDQRRSPARRELIVEGEPVRTRRALLSGWACRQRILSDGRRQILGLLMPGDLIGMCHQSSPLASTSILTINEVVTCPAPAAAPGSCLAEAYARSAALEEHYLLTHITRLGRLNAYERLADWLLEIQERLALVGMSASEPFPLPLTQEMLADTLGLTSVHVNRTLQTMRREGLLTAKGGMIAFPDRHSVERLVDYKPARLWSEA